jgi:hypothetical protein
LKKLTLKKCDCGRSFLPLGWLHINLTGEYQWRNSVKVGARAGPENSGLRPLSKP